MEFHVAQILRGPVGSRRDFDVDERCEVPDAVPPSFPVRGHVVLLRTDAGILATGSLTSEVQTTCSRCLAPACVPVEIQLEEEYYPTLDVVTGVRLPEPEDSNTFLIDEHHILDLCEAARQQLIIAEPMQPLCRDDCAGLCPTCGRDKNQGPCDCFAGDVDSRWAALGNLLKDSDR
jgi:uncharacterized protein